MKTMTAMAMMMLLYACGPEPSNKSEAAAAIANDTPTAAAPAGATVAAKTPAIPAASSGPANASAGDVAGEKKTRVEELAGNWRVVGVRVAPGPVQAVSEDDPALMGAVLSISPERLVWEPHEGGFFTDTCPGPQIGPYNSIGCTEGQFGPSKAHLTSKDVRLQLDWYNGAILTLAQNTGR